MPTYNAIDSQVCMTLSTFCYVDETDPSQIEAAIQGMLGNPSYSTNGDWTLLWLGLTPDDDVSNLIYLAQNTTQPNTFAFAIRGTDFSFPLDDFEDAFAVQLDWPFATVNPQPRVGAGFLTGLFALLAALVNGDTVQNRVKALTTQFNPSVPVTIYVTGHSLGGALATLFAPMLVELLKSISPTAFNYTIKNYTFAAPTAGDPNFVTYYAGLGAPNIKFDAFRIYNTPDIVPHGYNNLPNVGNDIGMEGAGLIEVDIVTDALAAILSANNIVYAPVNTGVPFTAANPGNLPTPPTTLSEFFQWAEFEHSHDTYLQLVGAKPVPLSNSVAEIQFVSHKQPVSKGGYVS